MREINQESPQSFVAGNYFDKFGSNNFLYRKLMNEFLRHARDLLHLARPRNIVEVGCGSGDFAWRLLKIGLDPNSIACYSYVGLDISSTQIELARRKYPELEFRTASAYQLPFGTATVDLVILCEVLEHLDNPSAAVSEAVRVSNDHVLVSVPWESTWRILNVMRGKYWRSWGNTPGHVQHFTRRAIRDLISGQLDIVAERHPFPWTMLLGRR